MDAVIGPHYPEDGSVHRAGRSGDRSQSLLGILVQVGTMPVRTCRNTLRR